MLFSLCLALTSAPVNAGEPSRPPNFVVIVADDVGVDMISAYGESAAAPCTPNIDALAAGGLLFRNAWANPVCSPTRAALLTGRYGFRTGIGQVVANDEPGLDLAETTIPELLSKHASACIGKWHLSGDLGNTHPNDSGFDHFAGLIRGAVNDYFQWPRVVDGVVGISNTYSTTAMTDDAVAWLQAQTEPWLLLVNYNAPHTPLHVPPAALCPGSACASTYCTSLPPNPNDRQLGRAVMQALDSEIGRLLATVSSVDPHAYVFFVGDNGTASQVSVPPFTPAHAKGSMYEGGVNVPLIVRGPRVTPGESAGLVSITDLYATLAQLAGVRSRAEDSVSLAPYFSRPNLSLRSSVYAETFAPNNATGPFASHGRAIRDERYKLIRRTGQADEFFDLAADPFETQDLFGGMNAAQQAAYDALAAELAALGVG